MILSFGEADEDDARAGLDGLAALDLRDGLARAFLAMASYSLRTCFPEY
jgi:hypothetical protein